MSKALVAYFSASGVTKGLAQRLSDAAKADLFEIIPKEEYTKADLNWMDKNSRSSVEMKDRNSRPEIESKIENIRRYETVFVGFPIWWYREPSIIDTFLEEYDFEGITVVPFATSGGSGMGDTSKYMKETKTKANVVSGKRFSSKASAEELKKWADEWL